MKVYYRSNHGHSSNCQWKFLLSCLWMNFSPIPFEVDLEAWIGVSSNSEINVDYCRLLHGKWPWFLIPMILNLDIFVIFHINHKNHPHRNFENMIDYLHGDNRPCVALVGQWIDVGKWMCVHVSIASWDFRNTYRLLNGVLRCQNVVR